MARRLTQNLYVLCAGIVLCVGGQSAQASEGGGSLYIPGLNVPDGGVLPPEGVFIDNTQLFYSGRQAGGVKTSIGGNVAVGVKAKIWGDFLTGLWVTPWQIMGGRFALSVSVPFGDPYVQAGAILSGPVLNKLVGHPVGVGASDSYLNFGDPVVSASLGWNSGNWFWKGGAAVSIPAGAYRPGELSNLAFNRWIGDFTWGVSYIDKEIGIDLSAVAGFTLNGTNSATDYRTGNEFHIDVSATKNLTKELSVGVIGSYYQQITGDSGSGATLGPYKGRDTAIGGTVGYTFMVGPVPISTRVKLLREIDVKNRPQGTIGWFQVSFPVWVPPRAPKS